VATIDQVLGSWVELVIARTARVGPPWIYFIELAFWLILMGALFGTLGFFNAIPANSLGESLPAGWEAAIPNHGEFIRWYLKDRHPVSFSLTILAFPVSLGGMLLVHRAEIRIRLRNNGRPKIGKIAAIALTAVIFLISFFLMTQPPRAYVVHAGRGGVSTVN